MAQQECCHRSPPPLSRVGSPEASTPSPKTTRQPCHATQQAHPCQPIPQHVPRADRSRAWSVAQGLGVFLWVYGCACPGLPTHKERIKKNGYHQQRPHGHTPNRRGRSSRSIPQLPSRLYHERIGLEHTTLRYPSIKQSPHRA